MVKLLPDPLPHHSSYHVLLITPSPLDPASLRGATAAHCRQPLPWWCIVPPDPTPWSIRLYKQSPVNTLQLLPGTPCFLLRPDYYTEPPTVGSKPSERQPRFLAMFTHPGPRAQPVRYLFSRKMLLWEALPLPHRWFTAASSQPAGRESISVCKHLCVAVTV